MFAAHNFFSGKPIQNNENLIKQKHLSATEKALNYLFLLLLKELLKWKRKTTCLSCLRKGEQSQHQGLPRRRAREGGWYDDLVQSQHRVSFPLMMPVGQGNQSSNQGGWGSWLRCRGRGQSCKAVQLWAIVLQVSHEARVWKIGLSDQGEGKDLSKMFLTMRSQRAKDSFNLCLFDFFGPNSGKKK